MMLIWPVRFLLPLLLLAACSQQPLLPYELHWR
jgi:hypothetical protein